MSSFPVMIAGHSQAKGKYFDLAPYKRALLTTPIPALPPAPTPKVSADTQVIEEGLLFQSSPATTSNSSHAFISNSPSRILVGGGVTLYTVTEQLYHNDMVSILSNPETSCISDMPPAKPKANEVYLIRCENSDDWKCDQYPWIQYGLKKVTIGSAVLEKKYFKIKQPGSISEQSGKRSRPVGSLEFRRTAFYFEDKKNLVLVQS
ncbi:unnamed protein product [Mytilus coruscus]|uniref:CG-1 domain-containing protein n=1 Tax=Mytilus coruscus TaxID=42192 RepID=A0A6J8BAC4_MYTCO|nr:unnamed protein product [Mytilus coruscus]